MTADRTDDLLRRLGRGEVAAAGDLHTAYAAYLQTVVRRQLSDRLRAGFDSADVVQSVWVHVVRQLGAAGWQVESEAQLRALLAVIARRRVATRARSHARSADVVRPGPADMDLVPGRDQARPSEAVQAGDLWDMMMQLCPPEHHELLRLRRDGLPLAEIAARCGLHEGSVRRILRCLSRELALRTGGRAAATAETVG